MKDVTVKVWAVVLIAIGVGICGYKSIYLGLPFEPNQETETWTVQAKITFEGEGGPAIIDFNLPNIFPGFLKLDEDFISNRFGLAVEELPESRRAQWAVRRARGKQVIYYRISVVESIKNSTWTDSPEFPVPPAYTEPYASAIRAIIDDVRKESANVSTYTRELLQRLNAPQPNENVKLIRDRARNDEQWIKEIINILKGVRIPARILWGIYVSDGANDVPLQPLLQVHNGQRWLTFHPRTNEAGLPKGFLVWQVGDKPLYELSGGENAQVIFSVTKSYRELIEVARMGAEQLDSLILAYSPLSLPVQSQNVYRLILMVPIGALIVVIFRIFVGFKTFGTFMPVLMALAFRETQLLWGIVLFSLIVSLGLMIRFYLERLRLLLIPRLTSILIVVVMLMLLVSLISNQLGVDSVLSVALFPMVILAMTIERMSISWEESGAREAMLQGAGSLVVASVSYLVMNSAQLMYLMSVFPELLLVLLALSLLMGRYTGYRLSELRRFREMNHQ